MGSAAVEALLFCTAFLPLDEGVDWFRQCTVSRYAGIFLDGACVVLASLNGKRVCFNVQCRIYVDSDSSLCFEIPFQVVVF